MISKKLFFALKPLLKIFGLSSYDLTLLKAIKHKEWIYRSQVDLPKVTFFYSSPKEITEEDISLCGRLIKAYAKTCRESNPQVLGPIWGGITKRRFGQLLMNLEKQDPYALAETLKVMFTSSFMYGISSADLYQGLYERRIGMKIWSLKILDEVVSLAEYLAIVRTECPEQGVIGFALKDGIEKVVIKMEEALDIPLGFPAIGNPYGLKCGKSLITMESPEHTYVALRVSEAVERFLSNLRLDVVEIGAGFGGMAFRLLTAEKTIGSYTIVDLPHVNVIQGYFLSKVFGAESVLFYGEALSASKQRIIRILPTHAIQTCENINLVINEDSMPEMPERFVTDYINWLKDKARGGIFYSYNQEAYSPVDGEAQVLVPQIIERVGGLRRVSRNCSWLHSGYVEEIYKI
jgi:hypothetical protein